MMKIYETINLRKALSYLPIFPEIYLFGIAFRDGQVKTIIVIILL